MYVTYDDLIQLGLLMVAIIGLVYKICHKDKKYPPRTTNLGGYFSFSLITRGTAKYHL